MSRSALRAGLVVFLFAAAIPAKDAGSTLTIWAERSIVTCGEQFRLYAQSRSAAGIPLLDQQISWYSTNPGVLTIDSNGVASTAGLGSVYIYALADGVQSGLNIQVLPSRVEVRAPRSSMFVDENMQFTATAYDINQKPVPDVNFNWTLVGANGFYTRVGSISPDGMLRALANGPLTVKASIPYYGTTDNGVNAYSGIAQIQIKTKFEYRLTPMLATQPVPSTFQLRPNSMTRLAGNDSGQITFVGSLDGLTNALMLYDNGRIDLLANSGVGGPLPGGYVWDFSTPGINNRGDVVARAVVRGEASGLLLANRNGSNYIVVEGQNAGIYSRLYNLTTTRYSINDSGEVVFLAYFHNQETDREGQGLFKLTADGIQAIYAGEPLPGIGGNLQVGYFGIDARGVVYFSVYSNGLYYDTGLYRADGQSPPEKIAGPGDTFDGSAITYLNVNAGFGISPDGTVGYAANLANMTTAVVRYRRSEPRQRTTIVYSVSQVHAVTATGDVVFTGSTASGWGIHRWSGAALSPSASPAVSPIVLSSAAIEGSLISNFTDAFVTAQGEVFAQVSTSANDFLVIRAANSSVAFKRGTAISATANLDFMGLVRGAHTGQPQLLMGGNSVSVFEWNSRSLSPIYITGDALPGGSSGNLTNIVRSGNGDTFITNSSGVFKYSSGRMEALMRLPAKFGNSVNLQWIPGWYEGDGISFGVNQNGGAAFPVWAESRWTVVSVDRGKTNLLMQLGGSTPTPSPLGGTFSDWLPNSGALVALDDAGRVMLGAQVSGGTSGVFIYENGEWRTAAVLGKTTINGEVVHDANLIRAVGRKFYVQFTTADYGWVVAEYNNGDWTPLISRGDRMPNGASINYVNRFDINHNGEMAVVGQVNSGTVLALRSTDGRYHAVLMTSDPAEGADVFIPYQNFSLSLLDDRRIYFTGIDTLDRNLLYLAEPLF